MFAKRKKPPRLQTTQLSSLVAEGVEITGDVVFSGGLRIDGRVIGNVVGRHAGGKTPALLVLSDTGHIEGNVLCGDAVINGAVSGDLDVEHFLELQSDARVCGAIRYRRMQMEIGAAVLGQLAMVDSPPSADNVIELAVDNAPAAGERR